MTRASTAVPEYRHWNNSLVKKNKQGDRWILNPSSGPGEEQGSDLTLTQNGCLW